MGGTPGLSNSVQGVFTDTIPPRLVHSFPKDAATVLLYFSEWPDTALAKDPQMYRLDPGGWTPTDVRMEKGKPCLELILPQSLVSGVSYELVVDPRLSDCSGNRLSGSIRLGLGLPQSISYGDLIITEVLFDPVADDGDFVEVMNRSTHAIDVTDLRFAHADPDDRIVKNAVGLQTERRLLMPGDYVVASVAPDRIVVRYPRNGGINLIPTSLSGYDDDKGVVVLMDAALRVLDEFKYADDYHYPLLADPEGVSLERIRFDGDSNDNQNWHSASSQCGYATPGLKNSQQLDVEAEVEAWFVLDPRLFSPDNDGHHDVLQIKTRLNKPGYMASIHVYNEYGVLVRRLAASHFVSPEAFWTWNGTNDDGELMPAGPYVVSARFVHIDGDVRTIRKACVLAPPWNSN
jgi:hypothetical protein